MAESEGAWLALVLASGIGPRRIARMNERFGSAANWPAHADSELAECGLNAANIRALRRPDEHALAACRDWLSADHHHLVTLDDEDFPPLLKRIEDPPPALFVVGDRDCLLRPQVAIVGSRSATPGGIDHARTFSDRLARAGFVITSGLAAGVDATAHQGCLAAGGRTIAVIGTGPDQVYPARHKKLAHEIMNAGALVSMFPPGTGVRAGNFPARNRLISGMSLGTLVVEAGLRSGSLITARLAGEQGREVFAIPGSVQNPLARGCHQLIRQGARLVESADEIVEELAPMAAELGDLLRELLAASDEPGLDNTGPAPNVPLEPEYEHLLEAVGFEPTAVDRIIERSELTTAEVSSMLLMLELDGRVVAHPGGRYSRTA